MDSLVLYTFRNNIILITERNFIMPTNRLVVEFDDETAYYEIDIPSAFMYICKYIEATINGDDNKRENIITKAITARLLPNKPVDYYCYDLESFDSVFRTYLTEVPEWSHKQEIAATNNTNVKYYSFAE